MNNPPGCCHQFVIWICHNDRESLGPVGQLRIVYHSIPEPSALFSQAHAA